ncbi:MAG TPA: glycosyltransferase, partial [Propionibacteriaceae bacterium]|nr:glycosyltransferase [Propionibacteriaceae bacterium]
MKSIGDRGSIAWPGVSVVMPVLNEQRHLEAAIRKVLDQDYPGELEVILAVGPSGDRTDEIAKALAGADPRIRVVDNPAARTPAGLNLGIAAAKHEIIVRVDGHGELTDGYIKRAVELLDETGAANVGGVMDAQGTTP